MSAPNKAVIARVEAGRVIKEQILALHRAGMGYEAMAAQIGRSLSTVAGVMCALRKSHPDDFPADTTVWPEVALMVLESGAASGKSAGVIALELMEAGFSKSRNAIIGKLRRDGIALRGGKIRDGLVMRCKPGPKPRPRRVVIKVSPVVKPAIAPVRVYGAPRVWPSDFIGVSILDLERGMCKNIARGEGFAAVYCGEATGACTTTYCQACRASNFRSAPASSAKPHPRVQIAQRFSGAWA